MGRITSLKVAQAAGVSRTTVSLVLNNAPGANISVETRQRVIETARQMGYVPDANARRLVTGRTHTLALAIHKPAAHAFADAYLSSTLSGITRTAKEHGFRISLEMTDQPADIRKLHDLLRSGDVDGLICEDWMREQHLLDTGFVPTDPLVVLSEQPLDNFSHVSVSLVGAQRSIVAEALGHGHKSFACITYTRQGQSESQDRRFADLQDQLAAEGARLVPDGVRSGDLTVDGAEAAMAAILAQTREPTVVFGMNDTMAVGALMALKKARIRVPEHMALIGFEGQEVTRLVTPPISTVRIPWARKGEIAAATLIDLIDAPERRVQKHRLDSEVLIRSSL